MLFPKLNSHDSSELKLESTKMQSKHADPSPSLTPLRSLFPQYIRKCSIHIKHEGPIDVARCAEPMELKQPSKCLDVTHPSLAPRCPNCGCALREPAARLPCDACLTILSPAPFNNETIESSAERSKHTRSKSITPPLHGVRSGKVPKSTGLGSRRSSSSDWPSRPHLGSPPTQLLTRKSLADKKRKADRERESRAALNIKYQQHEDFVRRNGWEGELNNFKLNRNNSGLSGLFAKKLVVLETSYKMLVWQKDELSGMAKEHERHQAFVRYAAERIPRDVWEKYGMFGDLVNLTPNREATPTSTTSVILYFTPEPTASPQPDFRPLPHPSKL